MFVVFLTTVVVLLCSQLGNAAVFLPHQIDLQTHEMGGSQKSTHRVEFIQNRVGRINGLGVYEPASAKPFPIVQKKKSSGTSSLPSIHWSELPMQKKTLQPHVPMSLSLSLSLKKIMKQAAPPQRMHESLKKMGIELNPHSFHPQPKFARPLLQAVTSAPSPSTTPSPSVSTTYVPTIKTTYVPTIKTTSVPSVKASVKTNQPTSSPTILSKYVPGPGSIKSGYVASYLQYDVADTTCSNTPTYAYLHPLGTCITYGYGGTMYTSDVKGNIYSTYFSSWKCRPQGYNSTYMYSPSKCAQCGGGYGCTGQYVFMKDLPAPAKPTSYMQMLGYDNATTCGGTATSVTMYQGSCYSSPCTLSNSSWSSVPSTYVTSCPNALPTGTIVTGFAIFGANYASTDTSCTTPTSVSYAPLGTCFQDYSSDGKPMASSIKLTADNDKNLFYLSYVNPTCTGTPYVYQIPKQSCQCSTDGTGCYTGYYSGDLPSYTSSQTDSYYSTANCADYPYSTITQVPTGGSCQASKCTAYSGGGGAQQTICGSPSGVATPTKGSTTTGWVLMYASYAETDKTCVNPLQAVYYPLGVCIKTYGSATSSTATGGTIYSADSTSGIIYQSTWYSSATCTGNADTSGQLPTSYQACTYNAKTSSSPASYTLNYVYVGSSYTSVPTPPTKGSWTTVTAYPSSKCSGIPSYIVMYPTTSDSPCSPSTCFAADTTVGVSIACTGTTATTTTTTATEITTGWGVYNATFALTDTSCASTPTSAGLYKLGVCIPSYSSSAVTSPDSSILFVSDTSGVISMKSYSATSCKGTPSVTPFPKQACACSNPGPKNTCIDTPDPTVGAYSNGFYYAANVPQVTGLTMTLTGYDTCTSLKPYYVNVQTSPYCYVQSCTTDSDGFSYGSTCSGISTKATITSGYYIASGTYALDDTNCDKLLSAVYYPVGQCINGGDGTSAMVKADSAGNTYTTLYGDSKCTTATAYYQPPKVGCTINSAGTGRESTDTFSKNLPSITGAVETLTYYTGASCATGGSITQVYTTSVTACSATACQSSKSGSYSYQTTCPAITAGPITKSPTPAPSKIGDTLAPTAAPTPEVVYVYVVIIVFAGISAEEFKNKDTDGKLTLALQVQIGKAIGFPSSDYSSIAIDVTARRKLAAAGNAPDKNTQVTSTIKDKNSKIKSTTSLGQSMTAASSSIASITPGITSAGITTQAPVVTVAPTVAPSAASATTSPTAKKSAASVTVRISEVTTYTAALLVGLVLAMMA